MADPRPRRKMRAIVAALLAIAIAVVLAFAIGRGRGDDPGVILLSSTQRADIAAALAARDGHPPDRAALAAGIAAWERQQIMAAEAVRAGLAGPDVARRAAAMEARMAAPAATADPGDAALARYISRHPRRYATDAQHTFAAVRFADRSRAVVGKVLIEGGARWDRLGDAPPQLPAGEYTGVDAAAVRRAFGAEFARALAALEPRPGWQGPLAGGHGWYLVRLLASEPGPPPPLAQIRAIVLADWRRDRARELGEAAYAEMRARYRVVSIR